MQPIILIRALMDSGVTRNDHDEDIEVERIYDLVDGLAIHAIQRPELMPPEKVKAVLRHHLSSL
ncbi:TetR family transcriptional regulator C-terminal domain-containing protein [Paenibacillus brevis]|uniref:TetR family transcriptional regulator C-terminal domain-containing protein n=1 Tax=Paenibacillus brevis TaxID=2841508 RepID=A0ABS6FVC6_9BACL|nr:TetR family transcriptional regulator C-terminal domain-containing protein [Paenibacillus brevis]